MKKKRKNNNIIRDIIKDKNLRVLILPLVFSFIFLIFGTYAWFTYFSDVNGTMTGHVIGWNIDFSGDSEIEDEYNVTIDEIYPGMENFKSELVISNSGEATAFLAFNIVEASILGEKYVIGDTYEGETITSEYLLNKLTNSYPFKFKLNISDEIVESGENSTFSVELEWDFETYIKLSEEATFDPTLEYFVLDDGKYIQETVNKDNFIDNKNQLYILNDDEDTYWGEKATSFMSENPDKSCIELKIEINASQYLD